MKCLNKSIGIVCGMYGYCHEQKLYFHTSFGRIIDEIASRCKRVFLCAPVRSGPPDKSRDYCIQVANLEIIPQPFFTSSLNGLKHPVGILRAYVRTCSKADFLLIRGMPPFGGLLYTSAWLHNNSVCHWIVGNPIALLKTHRRSGRIVDVLSLLYAYYHRFITRLGRWLVNGSFVCNGKELGESYKSCRTVIAISSTVKKGEFFERKDTCQGNKVRVLFIGFVRPEKGVEYLIEAAYRLCSQHALELVLAGPRNRFTAYSERLEQLIEQFGIKDMVRWAGYVSYGPEMFKYFREADVFVLPSLSEGAPHVLVEARANSVPIVATNVGGIPTSVKDGFDGLLVPPKDPVALASAIDRVISDDELRRSLICNGLKSARTMVLECFVDLIIETLDKSDVQGR